MACEGEFGLLLVLSAAEIDKFRFLLDEVIVIIRFPVFGWHNVDGITEIWPGAVSFVRRNVVRFAQGARWHRGPRSSTVRRLAV